MQINAGIMELIDLNLETQLIEHLTLMEQEQQLKTRVIEKRKSRIHCLLLENSIL